MKTTGQLAGLVSRLQSGDAEAYNELYVTYYGKARAWAKYIVQDSHLAEDVVQEAFFRLGEKIGQLEDPGKFHGWFRQMVRRLAINHIRGNSRSEVAIGEIPEPGGNKPESGNNGLDPLLHLLKRESESEIQRLSLAPLSKQARELFASHAFEEATSEQLAARFGMKKSNVYNILSRSRAKANDERFHREIDRYTRERRRLVLPIVRSLPPPAYRRPYALISILMQDVLGAIGEPDWHITDLMGISGDAFRLNMPDCCDWRSISTFDWSYAAYRTMERLGISGTCYGRPSRTFVPPEQQVRMLSIMQDTIDRGVPAIIWNMEINEFGFVYGYDDESQTISYQGYNRVARTFRYDQLGRTGQEPSLFIAAIGKRVAPPASDSTVIASIVDHARGKEPAIPGFSFGLQGYRLWLEAIISERLDLQGHAYQVAILAEARQHAALYLERLAERSDTDERRLQLFEAAKCYSRVSDSFARLYPSFPFGYGSGRTDRLTAIHEGIRTAMEAETEGVALLENIFLPR